MVQSIDFYKPVYNAVNIGIKKPEVDLSGKKNVSNPMEVNNDNGIYNAVKIDIDSPKINTQQKNIYDYPEAEGIVTYDMLSFQPVALPAESIEKNKEDITDTTKDLSEENNIVELPKANYTTLEAEKKTEISENNTLEPTTKLSFKASENISKKPEIVPSEPILPRVDITKVTENLSSSDKDVQAKQLEEIAKLTFVEPEKAKDYLVSDVFTALINIAGEDATKLAPPTQQQIENRQKLITNIMAVEKDKNAINNLPYPMSDEEVAIATSLSPMELAERNKEYAIITIGALAELFIKDYEAKEGKIVPITDVPGVSAVVNALRKDPDSSIKIAAMDALMHIRRPEYKEELSALFTLAQSDPNPNVSNIATKAIGVINS